MKVFSWSRTVLMGLAMSGAAAGTAHADRIYKYKITQHDARAKWTVVSPEGCLDTVYVSVAKVREVTWNLDTGARTESLLGPDITAAIEREYGCFPGFEVASDPFALPTTWPAGTPQHERPYYVSSANHQTDFVAVNLDHLGLYYYGGDLSYDTSVHLQWSGKGEPVQKFVECFVVPDPDANTCLKIRSRGFVRNATLTGDFSGTVSSSLGSYPADHTPGDFSIQAPGDIVIRSIESVETFRETANGGGCQCPAPFEPVIE